VSVAVLDTGLDPHPWFAPRPWLSEWGLAVEVLDGDGAPGQDRLAGHGTFVAGVLLQSAPGVTVRARRALSSTGLSDDTIVSDELARLRKAASARGAHIDIVLFTGGAQTADNRCPPVLAAELARFTGAAAGNNGGERPFWPAALPEVIAVGASDENGVTAGSSNRGEWSTRSRAG
jgi:hypothetical protein